jgi:nucleoid-associated protein YgaU
VQAGAPVGAAKDLQLTAVDYDATGNIVFSGTATPGSVVRFYVDNTATGEGVADASGKWRFAGTSTVSPGTHTLRADIVDAAGKVQNRIELPFLREAPQVVAAAQVVPPNPAAAQVAAPEVVAIPAPKVETPPAAAPQVASVQAPAVTMPVVEEGPRKLVIQPGNSLWKLSRDVYGKGRMYTVIFEANKDLVKNPNRIYPGQILTAPKQN